MLDPGLLFRHLHSTSTQLHRACIRPGPGVSCILLLCISLSLAQYKVIEAVGSSFRLDGLDRISDMPFRLPISFFSMLDA